MSQYLNDLKQLIETAYEENSHQPVILLGHSMGNLYIHYLLTHQSNRWKHKYIKSFVSLSGPWGGAIKSIRLEISGWLVVGLVIFWPLVTYFILQLLIMHLLFMWVVKKSACNVCQYNLISSGRQIQLVYVFWCKLVAACRVLIYNGSHNVLPSCARANSDLCKNDSELMSEDCNV